MEKTFLKYLLYSFLGIVFLSCQKEITVDLPYSETQIAVEGRIEQGLPPMVVLTRTMGYFDPIDANSLKNMFVKGATVTVSDGTYTATLTEFCAASLTPQELELFAQFTGIPEDQLQSLDYCIYTSTDPNIFGQPNTYYTLSITTADGENLSSVTKIPQPVSLDDTWFKRIEGAADTLGFVWARLTDPDTLGNAYRWYAMRINTYKFGPDADQQKDATFIAPRGSAFDDKFFNGTSFDFSVVRGRIPNSSKPDDNNSERGFYKVGDTVVVKFTSIDYNVYKFLFQAETQLGNNGSPFESPSTLPTNIEGGVGIWAGYAVYLDTIYCNP